MREVALAFVELTKPRIVSLVMLTGIPALLMATRGLPQARTVVGAIVGTSLAAASAAAFNHYFDRDIDALMVRTRQRPLPAGTLTPAQAMAFAFVLGALSLTVLWTLTNRLAAFIGLASIVYYAVVYTIWLKRATPQNIVIGGGAGATAPLIAWAAVTGSVGLPAVALAAIVFFWTPPHFWALALYRRDDYVRAAIPMLPVTHGDEETRRQILLYAIGLLPVTLAPVALRASGWLYGVTAFLLGAWFAWLAWRLYATRETARAVRLFHFSIAYLFVLFIVMGVDAWWLGARNAERARTARAESESVVATQAMRVILHVGVSVPAGLPVEAPAGESRLESKRGVPFTVSLPLDCRGDRPLEVRLERHVEPAAAAPFVGPADSSAASASGTLRLEPGVPRGLVQKLVLDPRLPAEFSELHIRYVVSSSDSGGKPADSPARSGR
jgi:protoheme IX farnesyltransferase